MTDFEVLDLERKEGIAAALVVASSFIYDEPDEQRIAAWAEGGLFEMPPFDTADEALRNGLAMMDAWCASAQGGFSEAVAGLKREHLRLFLGCGAPLVPSWATFYSDTNHQMLGLETLEVRSAYREFGLRIEREHNEPDDHLGLMMRFLSHVLQLECDARKRSDELEAARLRDIQESFLVAHVLPWIAVWAYSGRKEASSDYFRGAVNFVFGLVREYAALFDISYCEEPPSFKRRAV